MAALLMLYFGACAVAQSLGGAGTVHEFVTDQTGARLPSAKVELSKPDTCYVRKLATAPDGAFVFYNEF